MRKLFLLILIMLALSVALTMMISIDAGYVRVSWGNYLLETSVWIALAAITLLVVTLSIVSKSWRGIKSSTGGVSNWFLSTSGQRARKRTTRGLLELAEGNWKRAQKHLSKAAPKAETPLINYLAAAQAAFEQGNEQDTETLLRKAYESTPGSDLAVGITQAQLQLGSNQLEQCLATLLRLRKHAPQHPFILKLLKNVYFKLEDWHQLSVLIPELRRQRIAESHELDMLERETWINLLAHTADEIRRQSGSSQNIEQLNQHWDRLPGSMRRDETIIHAYAEHLASLGQQAQAETLLRKVLRNHWSDMLIDLYGKVCGNSPEEQLLTAENWLKERPNNETLLLALGRLSLRNQLWGKAKEYFQASHRIKKTPQTYGELCRLSAHLEEHQQSSEYFMQGIMELVGLPELPQPDKR